MTEQPIASFLLSNANSFVLGGLSSYLATSVYEKCKLRARSVAELSIFDFSGRDLIIVVPHRGRESDSIMPRVAVEDVLSMKNILSITARLYPDMCIKVRDASHLTPEDRKANIVTLGGSKVNSFTAEVLQGYEQVCFRFEEDTTPGNWLLHRNNDTIFKSQSHEVSDESSPELPREDRGLVMKLRNPTNADRRIFVIAGIRGIGTWGATDCLRKQMRDVFAKKRADSGYQKTGEFCMVVSVKYEEFDIKKTQIADFEDFK